MSTTLIPGTSTATPATRYFRKIDAQGDYLFGNGLADWWGFQSEAVAQSVITRLNLQVGDWFLDVTDGIDWNTKVLGKTSPQTRDMVIKARILGTRYLTQIESFSSKVTPQRQYSLLCGLLTQFSGETIDVANVL